MDADGSSRALEVKTSPLGEGQKILNTYNWLYLLPQLIYNKQIKNRLRKFMVTIRSCVKADSVTFFKKIFINIIFHIASAHLQPETKQGHFVQVELSSVVRFNETRSR